MPVALQPRRGRRLSWRDMGKLLGLLALVRIEHWRMAQASNRFARYGRPADCEALAAYSARWVDLHTRIARVFEAPVPANVAEVGALVSEPGGPGSSEPPGRHITTADRGSAEVS